MFISNAFAQTAPAAADAAGPSLMNSLMLPALMVVVIGFMFWSQIKKQKEHRALLNALAKGDEVVTASGLMGKVTALSDNAITVQIAAGVEVQMQRSAVVQVLPKGTIK